MWIFSENQLQAVTVSGSLCSVTEEERKTEIRGHLRGQKATLQARHHRVYTSAPNQRTGRRSQ
jgi:hypothetical protein